MEKKALRESEQRLLKIVNIIPALIGYVNSDQRYVFANKEHKKWFGLPPSVIKGKRIKDVLGEAAYARVRDKIESALSGQRVSCEDSLILPHGGVRHFHAEYIPQMDKKGNPSGFYLIAHDITERRNLESQLLHAQKMEAVGRLAGGVAHDFNNILSAIINYTYILEGNLKENDPSGAGIAKILSLTEKAAQITRGLLAFSRKQHLEFAPVRLNDIIGTISKLIASFIGEDVSIRTKFTSKEPVIFADRTQIEQVIMNLATNVRDAMPDGGNLIIKTDVVEIGDNFKVDGLVEPGSYALLSVSDTGTGMNEETRQKVFEPFFTTKEVGTGLGLSIIYGIIKEHKGYINVHSEPGKGTTFRIYLPEVKAKPEIKATIEKKKTKKFLDLKGKGETILVAEDEAAVRDSIRIILERSGYKVIEAVDGEDAAEKFLKHKDEIGLLILDVVMPQKNGMEAYEEAKKLRPEIKAILLSGYPPELMHRQELLEGCINFAVKPVQPDNLLTQIKEALKNDDGNS